MMGLPGRLDFPWAEVLSVHCVGSYWAPGFSNYLLLFQVRSHKKNIEYVPASEFFFVFSYDWTLAFNFLQLYNYFSQRNT